MKQTMLPAVIATLLLIFPATALAQGLDIEKVKSLKDEGKVHFDASANVDLSPTERNKERKAAFKLLSEAFKILDEWCDAHQEDAEKYEDLMVEIHQMRYWLRKESPIGLLEDDDSNVRKGKPPDWPDKPPEDPTPTDPGTSAPVAPAPDPVVDHLAHAAKYEREHPYDLAGIRDLYLDILEHTEPGSEAYEKALKRVSELNSKLKEGYRRLRGDDPDTLKLTGTEERRIVHSLGKDLKSSETDVRLRAAQYLGLLGSGEGARHLADLLKREKDPDVRNMALESLSKIGGSKACEKLGELSKSRKEEHQREALAVLQTLAGRSDVDGRYASSALGRYVKAKSDAIAQEAIEVLAGMGQNGVYGLVEAADVKNHHRRLRVLRALGETGDGQAALGLGPYLVFGAKGNSAGYKNVAQEGLKKIGMPVVPYLARFLGDPSRRQWTKYVLREITGVSFKSPKQALAWWEGR